MPLSVAIVISTPLGPRSVWSSKGVFAGKSAEDLVAKLGSHPFGVGVPSLAVIGRLEAGPRAAPDPRSGRIRGS